MLETFTDVARMTWHIRDAAIQAGNLKPALYLDHGNIIQIDAQSCDLPDLSDAHQLMRTLLLEVLREIGMADEWHAVSRSNAFEGWLSDFKAKHHTFKELYIQNPVPPPEFRCERCGYLFDSTTERSKKCLACGKVSKNPYYME
jgi:hypothetical protein